MLDIKFTATKFHSIAHLVLLLAILVQVNNSIKMKKNSIIAVLNRKA
jgi:energy-converting hydrogenase Eha subunit C